jgi:hypothetical protein
MTPKSRDGGAAYAPGVTSLLRTSKLAVGALQTWLTDIRARSEVGDMIAAIAGFPARQQTARPMAGGGAECTIVGRTPAAIVVQAPTVSIGILEGAGTTLTNNPRGITIQRKTTLDRYSSSQIQSNCIESSRCNGALRRAVLHK